MEAEQKGGGLGKNEIGRCMIGKGNALRKSDGRDEGRRFDL
jgi:hypothetical protein